MRKTHYVRLLVASLAAFAVLGAACSDNDNNNNGNGGGGNGGPAFDPERADELAHAMALAPEDLPGSGWEVVGRDEFDDDEESDEEFERLIEDIPECQGLSDLARLAEVLGESDEEDPPAGRAQVEIERPGAEFLPVNVEMEVEIEETVSDIQSGWQIAKDLFESDSIRECFPALMQAAAFEEADELEGIEFQIEGRDAAAEAPEDGISLAFLMKVDVSGLMQFDLAVDMYMWPHSNAGITLMVMRDLESMEDDEVQAIVDAADKKVRAAAE